jgi:hypothetical protein
MSLKEANWDWEGVLARSEALFGSPHRLRVALLLSVADQEELYAARIGGAAGIDRKQATRELAAFEQAQILLPRSDKPTPRRRGRPADLVTRADEDAWSALQALGERFRRTPPHAPQG